MSTRPNRTGADPRVVRFGSFKGTVRGLFACERQRERRPSVERAPRNYCLQAWEGLVGLGVHPNATLSGALAISRS